MIISVIPPKFYHRTNEWILSLVIKKKGIEKPLIQKIKSKDLLYIKDVYNKYMKLLRKQNKTILSTYKFEKTR